MAHIPFDFVFWLAVFSALTGMILGAGACTGAWSWRAVWSQVGALGGLLTFSTWYMAAPFGTQSLAPLSMLFVGSGVAVAYGTLFLERPRAPTLPSPTHAGERLEALDWADRLRPHPMDWCLTALLAAPAAGLAYVGLEVLSSWPAFVVGVGALTGPLLAGARLVGRALHSRRFEHLGLRSGSGESITPPVLG